MYPTRNDVPQAKARLLAIVMVGLLAVSVALAWLVTRPPKDASPYGAEIIAKLTADTLEGYWTGSDQTRWFIAVTEDMKPLGWEKRSRNRKTKGMFSENQIHENITGSRYESNWRINADLSEGLYVSKHRDKKTRNKRSVETRITLSKNKITVVRKIADRKTTATAPRPDNYVPEGTFPLVLRLVAARGTSATVKMIVDQHAIEKGAVNFVDFRLTPLSDNVVRVSCSSRKFSPMVVYHLAQDHQVYRYEYPLQGIIYRMCEKELVKKTFPKLDEGPATKPAP
ncbi:MAG: hypothetical protein QGH60_03260 [Phycisphaerae bacterium]|jgi:hypothetical protein|nr:hypothetical protein [Phycisphaerae bacterium]